MVLFAWRMVLNSSVKILRETRCTENLVESMHGVRFHSCDPEHLQLRNIKTEKSWQTAKEHRILIEFQAPTVDSWGTVAFRRFHAHPFGWCCAKSVDRHPGDSFCAANFTTNLVGDIWLNMIVNDFLWLTIIIYEVHTHIYICIDVYAYIYIILWYIMIARTTMQVACKESAPMGKPTMVSS